LSNRDKMFKNVDIVLNKSVLNHRVISDDLN